MSMARKHIEKVLVILADDIKRCERKSNHEIGKMASWYQERARMFTSQAEELEFVLQMMDHDDGMRKIHSRIEGLSA